MTVNFSTTYFIKFLISCVICWLVLEIRYTQALDPSAQAEQTSIDVVLIKDQPVYRRKPVVFDVLYHNYTFNVILTGSSLSNTGKVWVLVKAEGKPDYRLFGPATKNFEDDHNWIVPNVYLDRSDSVQAKHFTLQAGVSTSNQIKLGQIVNSLDQFSVVSLPVDIVVDKWIPESFGLTIDTINQLKVEPKTRIVVEANADIHGTLPDVKDNKDSKIYLILHPEKSNIWLVAGHAIKTNDKEWNALDVLFAESNQLHWRDIDIFAIESNQPLKPGPIPYDVIEKSLSVSNSVEISIIPEALKPPEAIIKYITSSDGKKELQQAEKPIEVEDIEVFLEGTVQALPNGKSLWALLNPIGTSLWIVQEGPARVTESPVSLAGSPTNPPTNSTNSTNHLNRRERGRTRNQEQQVVHLTESTAIVDGNRWTLPSVRLEAPWNKSIDTFRLLLVTSSSMLPEHAILDYNTWQRQGTIVSGLLIFKRKLKNN